VFKSCHNEVLTIITEEPLDSKEDSLEEFTGTLLYQRDWEKKKKERKYKGKYYIPLRLVLISFCPN
jgi:hypothetical protein